MITDENIIQKELQGLRGFINFWYWQGPIWIWNRSLLTIQNFESIIAIRSMLAHIREPIFQDYTRAGRLIGFLIRLLRIFAGLGFYLFILVFYLFLMIIWLVLPLVAISQIFRGLFQF